MAMVIGAADTLVRLYIGMVRRKAISRVEISDMGKLDERGTDEAARARVHTLVVLCKAIAPLTEALCASLNGVEANVDFENHLAAVIDLADRRSGGMITSYAQVHSYGMDTPAAAALLQNQEEMQALAESISVSLASQNHHSQPPIRMSGIGGMAAGAVTGRISPRQPRMQNIPFPETPEGIRLRKLMRDAFATAATVKDMEAKGDTLRVAPTPEPIIATTPPEEGEKKEALAGEEPEAGDAPTHPLIKYLAWDVRKVHAKKPPVEEMIVGDVFLERRFFHDGRDRVIPVVIQNVYKNFNGELTYGASPVLEAIWRGYIPPLTPCTHEILGNHAMADLFRTLRTDTLTALAAISWVPRTLHIDRPIDAAVGDLVLLDKARLEVVVKIGKDVVERCLIEKLPEGFHPEDPQNRMPALPEGYSVPLLEFLPWIPARIHYEELSTSTKEGERPAAGHLLIKKSNYTHRFHSEAYALVPRKDGVLDVLPILIAIAKNYVPEGAARIRNAVENTALADTLQRLLAKNRRALSAIGWVPARIHMNTVGEAWGVGDLVLTSFTDLLCVITDSTISTIRMVPLAHLPKDYIPMSATDRHWSLSIPKAG